MAGPPRPSPVTPRPPRTGVLPPPYPGRRTPVAGGRPGRPNRRSSAAISGRMNAGWGGGRGRTWGARPEGSVGGDGSPADRSLRVHDGGGPAGRRAGRRAGDVQPVRAEPAPRPGLPRGGGAPRRDAVPGRLAVRRRRRGPAGGRRTVRRRLPGLAGRPALHRPGPGGPRGTDRV